MEDKNKKSGLTASIVGILFGSQEGILSRELFDPYKSLGNNKTVKLMDIVKFYEKNFQEKVKKNFRGMQQGDVEKTYANINSLKKISNFKPNTKIEKGLKKFIDWFNDYE